MIMIIIKIILGLALCTLGICIFALLINLLMIIAEAFRIFMNMDK